MKNKICVYAICKNERQFVDRWLNSMQEADSIVVMDTGSTDDTYEYFLQKQKEYPQLIVAQQIINPWRFDVARNESMKYIPKDCNILFSTDLDEILHPGWGNELRNRWIEGIHERGLYLYTWSHLEDGSPGRIITYDKIHSRNWIWKAPVHEYLFNIKENTENYDVTKTISFYDTDIIHLEHFADNTKSRKSYLPLLQLRAQESPNDYFGLIYLGREYMFNNQFNEAIEVFNKIINQFTEYIGQLDYTSCYYFLSNCYFSLNNYEQAIVYGQQAINADATYREPYILMAQIFFQQQNYILAKAYLFDGINYSIRHYSWLENDISWSWEPWDLLCQICFYKGDRLESIGYAAKALSYEPTNQRLKNNLDICIQLSEEQDLIKY